jgi:transposase
MGEFHLSPAERRVLESQLKEVNDVASFRRRIALLELGGGRTVTETARILRVTRQAIYDWIDAFRRHGHPDPHQSRGDPMNTSGLMGRPSLFTQELEDLLDALLDYSPRDLGYQAMIWTVPLLLEHLKAVEGTHLSDSTLRRQLKSMGQSWKRGRYTLLPDTQLAKKSGLYGRK